MPSKLRRPRGPRGGETTITPGGLRATTLTLDPDDLEALRDLAHKRRTSLAEQVRIAIREYLDRQSKRPE